tara:strand:+ start:398 stop:787 length:390 start_codon:yes stop_codon:yes gene_type:complete
MKLDYTEDCNILYEALKDGLWHTLYALRKETGVTNPHKRMADMRGLGFVVESYKKNQVTYYKLVHHTVPVVDDRVQFPEINEVRSHKRNEEMLIEQMNRVRVLAAHCGNRDIERTAERALMAAGVSVGN